MKRIKADLSEGELKELEKRFAAVAGPTGGAVAAAAAGGVRYVELLHWGAPRRVLGGGEEVRFEVLTVIVATFLPLTTANQANPKRGKYNVRMDDRPALRRPPLLSSSVASSRKVLHQHDAKAKLSETISYLRCVDMMAACLRRGR